MSVYSPKERAQLATTANMITAGQRAATEALGPFIADKLRTELPDLDDLTIGRVLVALTIQMPALFLEEQSSLHLAWTGMTSAGLEMTRPEWDSMEAQGGNSTEEG
jgi:hypothetical protein